MNTLWLPLLLSSVVRAEEQYFPQLPNATWDEARLYCQSCFRELTTVTSRNVHLIVQNLSSDYWVGLRKSYNGSFPWEAWSNGDPVTYQNWYPGHPIPNKEKKLIPICSSTTESPLSTVITATTATPMTSLETSTVTSAPVTLPKTSTMWKKIQEEEEDTCPLLNDMLDCLNMTCHDLESFMATCNRTTIVTPKTTTYNTTHEGTTFSTTFNATTTKHTTTEHATTESPTTERTTTSNCVFEPEPDPEQYIEDACVVLLRFGMWKEEDCNTSLPYICYEERFFGQIYVSYVNTSAANLSWSEGPGAENISHYRVEITGDKNQTFNQTGLFQHIQDLTAGTLYRVQVFPVKCGRDLNPQNISFYTQPSDVQNLAILGMTIDSANLSWSKPVGNHEFYSVTFTNESKPANKLCDSENCTITGLIPGTKYEFTVKAVVNKTFGGVPSSASDYTKPSTVRNLKQSDEKHSTKIIASWDPPKGGHSGYHYCLIEVKSNQNCTSCSTAPSSSSTTQTTVCKNTTDNQISENGVLDGSKFCLCVQALTKSDSISGEMVAISAYTRPKTVNLSLTANSKSIDVNWTIEGNHEKFKVTITTGSYNYTKEDYTTEPQYTFNSLKAGVNYTVSVITVNSDLESAPAIQSIYTRPVKPAWINATTTKDSMDVFWGAPADSKDAVINYKVDCYTAFWNKSYSNETTYEHFHFASLNPGTRYECNVIVLAGNLMSEPVTNYANTVPEKRTLVLSLMCSSVTALHCDQNNTRTELFEKLKSITNNKFKNNVHWSLRWTKKI